MESQEEDGPVTLDLRQRIEACCPCLLYAPLCLSCAKRLELGLPAGAYHIGCTYPLHALALEIQEPPATSWRSHDPRPSPTD